MNVLLIGSGGREHALAYTLSKSASVTSLYSTPANPGILSVTEPASVNPNDFEKISEFCFFKKIDLVVVGPEQPLADGIGNFLRSKGIALFGPDKEAAKLESSKAYAKEFMLRHSIPTAKFKKFSKEEKDKAAQYIKEQHFPVVIKADGLAAGKGVIVAASQTEAVQALETMYSGAFGTSGNVVVIEEFLEGQEASILAVCDGKNFVTLASSQDHKRIYDGDKGPNTGGMGAYSPAPLVSPDILEKVQQKIISPVLKGMSEEGSPFIGCLYAGLMVKDGEPVVVEFNVRFGDPETQAVLSVFDGDFAGLLYSASVGKLDKSCIKNVSNGYACCVVIASGGYPGSFSKGYEILCTGGEEETGDVIVFHAGTAIDSGRLVTSGGRVFGVTGLGKSLKEAIDSAYMTVDRIHFDNKYYRRDIGLKGLPVML